MNLDRLKSTREAKRGDLCPLVQAYRGDRLIGVIQAPQVNRDQALQAAHAVIVGWCADRVTLAMDAHISSSTTNPTTGKPWGPGEMQNVCQNDRLCGIGHVVTDALVVMDAWATGRMVEHTLPYHVHTDRTVRWAEAGPMLDTADTNTEVAGLVPDLLRDYFARPSLVSQMGDPTEFGLTPVRALAHATCAIAKQLTERGFFVVLFPAGEEEAEVFERSLAGSAVTVMPPVSGAFQ